MVNGPHQADAYRVVHHQWHTSLMRNLRQQIEVRHVQLRVPDGLGIDRPSLRRNRLAESLRLLRIHKLHLAA